MFWRKLDLSETTTVEDDNICCDGALEKFKENFNKQSKVGKMWYMKKLINIYDPSTTELEEPVIQENTRGRPSMKKQQKKNANPPKEAPRRCSYSTKSDFIGPDLNKEPERHSYSYDIDLNDEPQIHDPFLMTRIPYIFHDYVDDIHDVIGDGNCGFRAVAVCLGRGEDQWLHIRQLLLEELQSEYYAYQTVFTDGFNELYESLCWSESHAPI